MIPNSLRDRLFPNLREIVGHYGSPCIIYDEQGIRDQCRMLNRQLRLVDPEYRNHFAVKALPIDSILQIVQEEGMGFDCSSEPEVVQVRRLGARRGDVMYTANNTSRRDYLVATGKKGGILNLDDTSFIDDVPKFPKRLFFRYSPGPLRTGNPILGEPKDAKYGVPDEQILQAYQWAIERGAEEFGLHTMICSNQRDYRYMVDTVKMVLQVAERLWRYVGIKLDTVNIGGGIGIPYRPDDETFNLPELARQAKELFDRFEDSFGFRPHLLTECGRYVTGPHGVLVMEVINRMSKYHQYVGVDASASACPRPFIYNAYHHIEVLDGEGRPTEVVNVVGSLCENADQWAKDRVLPVTRRGDLMVMANAGAHAIAMGSWYNARLWPKQLLLRCDGSVELIGRASTIRDYLMRFRVMKPNVFKPARVA